MVLHALVEALAALERQLEPVYAEVEGEHLETAVMHYRIGAEVVYVHDTGLAEEQHIRQLAEAAVAIQLHVLSPDPEHPVERGDDHIHVAVELGRGGYLAADIALESLERRHQGVHYGQEPYHPVDLHAV